MAKPIKILELHYPVIQFLIMCITPFDLTFGGSYPCVTGIKSKIVFGLDSQ